MNLINLYTLHKNKVFEDDNSGYNEEDSTSRRRCIYLHCWGGRGRTGLVASCFLSLLYPELESSTILSWIQLGYDSRLGSDQMPIGLQKSPQTESQKSFVRNFVKERRQQKMLQ